MCVFVDGCGVGFHEFAACFRTDAHAGSASTLLTTSFPCMSCHGCLACVVSFARARVCWRTCCTRLVVSHGCSNPRATDVIHGHKTIHPHLFHHVDRCIFLLLRRRNAHVRLHVSSTLSRRRLRVWMRRTEEKKRRKMQKKWE